MKSKRNKHNTAVSGAVNKEKSFTNDLKASFLGLLITLCIALALLLIGTAVAFYTGDPLSFVDPIGYTSLFLSAFLGGYICSKLNRASPYLTSLLTAVLFIFTLMICAFALPHTLDSGIELAHRSMLYAAAFLMFPVGALVSTRAQRPSRQAKRKHR